MPNSNLTKSNQKQKSDNSEYKPKYLRKHVIIPIEDLQWKQTQKPAVKQLFDECWLSDPYGSRWMPLKTALKRAAFMKAKKILGDQGLFLFKPDKSIRDGRETICWLVKNLHGSRVSQYWQSTDTDSEFTRTDLESSKKDCTSTQTDSQSTQKDLESTDIDSINLQSQQTQRFQDSSVSPQELVSNSSKELLTSSNVFPQLVSPPEGADASANELEEEVVVDGRQMWIDTMKKLVEAKEARRKKSLRY